MKKTKKNTMVVRINHDDYIRIIVNCGTMWSAGWEVPTKAQFIEIKRERKK